MVEVFSSSLASGMATITGTWVEPAGVCIGRETCFTERRIKTVHVKKYSVSIETITGILPAFG